MLVSKHINEVNNIQTEIHQIAANVFEVKRYWIKFNGYDLVLRNQYYYDTLEKAQGMYDAIK